jgi:lipoprotein-releasing system permease protein
MERVATIATAISVMVIILTLAVVVGFKQGVGELISSSSSDVVITAPQSRGVVSEVRIERSEALESLLAQQTDVERYAPYIAKEGVIKSDDNLVGVLLKGVDTTYDTSFFERSLIRGTAPRIGQEPRSKDVILSESVARRMAVDVGDRVEMLFVDDNGAILRDRFSLSGIYRTGVDAIDNALVLTDMRNVAREYDGDDMLVTGYEVWLKDRERAESVEASLNGALGELFLSEGLLAEAFAIARVYPEVFGWLATHDINALVVTVIMVVVALLNMITALLIIVLERQRMIGELRAIGMSRRGVVTIFIYRAMFIVLRGVVWGTLLGVALAAIQHIWAPIPLPSEGYLLTAVPAAMCWGWWGVAVASTIVVAMVVMVIPALFSARTSPDKAIRYE